MAKHESECTYIRMDNSQISEKTFFVPLGFGGYLLTIEFEGIEINYEITKSRPWGRTTDQTTSKCLAITPLFPFDEQNISVNFIHGLEPVSNQVPCNNPHFSKPPTHFSRDV